LEKWDVYDENGIPTGKTKARGDVFGAGEYYLGVCAWIVNSNGELLIQKRSANKRIRPGIWASTSGSVLAGESGIYGCIREVKEETGIDVSERELVFLNRIFRGNHILDDYIVVKDIPIDEVVIQPEEVSDVKWATVAEIKELWASGMFMLDDIDDMKLVFDYIYDT